VQEKNLGKGLLLAIILITIQSCASETKKVLPVLTLSDTNYPNHSCNKKPSKPRIPDKVLVNKNIELYNLKISKYNLSVKEYNKDINNYKTCINQYIKKGNKDINVIRKQLNKALKEAREN